jgi:hypothetical protein
MIENTLLRRQLLELISAPETTLIRALVTAVRRDGWTFRPGQPLLYTFPAVGGQWERNTRIAFIFAPLLWTVVAVVIAIVDQVTG